MERNDTDCYYYFWNNKVYSVYYYLKSMEVIYKVCFLPHKQECDF
jgi:hypothetical protein